MSKRKWTLTAAVEAENERTRKPIDDAMREMNKRILDECISRNAKAMADLVVRDTLDAVIRMASK